MLARRTCYFIGMIEVCIIQRGWYFFIRATNLSLFDKKNDWHSGAYSQPPHEVFDWFRTTTNPAYHQKASRVSRKQYISHLFSVLMYSIPASNCSLLKESTSPTFLLRVQCRQYIEQILLTWNNTRSGVSVSNHLHLAIFIPRQRVGTFRL